MLPRLPYRAILALGIATLTLAAVPGGASAHTPAVSRSQAAPVFVFPSNGQSFPLNGSMLFQVQPMSGAKGYLWSFVQGGAIMYQNLAWAGKLGGTTYSIKKGSAAQRRLHGGPLQVWVRALMGNSQWSGSSSVSVQLQGSGGSGPKPQPTTKAGPPAPGTVLYQANWSSGKAGWVGSSDWQVMNGVLFNGGTNNDAYGSDTGISLVAPYRPTVADYAVQADIQFAQSTDSYFYGFGLGARVTDSGLYRGGVIYWCNACGPGTTPTAYLLQGQGSVNPGNSPSGMELGHQSFDPSTDYHTYRLEVHGAAITLSIDGNPLLTATDIHDTRPGQVGLWCVSAKINVRSFKVIAL